MLFRNHHTNKKVEVPITPEIRALLDVAKKHTVKGVFAIVNRIGQPFTVEGFRAGWQRLMKAHRLRMPGEFVFPLDERNWRTRV
jgi:hypothetical protein